MSATLAAIRAGQAEKLPPDLPAEIEPLARELDALVDSNRQIVERARTHVGNLAHALKTPLSVIANEAGVASDAAAGGRLMHQVEVMRMQIDHHLAARPHRRAPSASSAPSPRWRRSSRAWCEPWRKSIMRKGLAIELAIEGTPRFRGEKQDLEEMVGNLVDNACKWAARAGRASACAPIERPASPSSRVTIDDDGPGLPEERRDEAGRRGRRLDETKPGTGLGLAIVADLVALYGGALSLAEAPGGGLAAGLELPAVAA